MQRKALKIHKIYSRFNVYLISLLIFISLNLLYAFTQKAISNNDGKGWDGVYYYEITEQIINGENISTISPFIYRIGTPLLVAILSPGDIHLGFKVINLIFNLISLLIFVYWLNIFLKNYYVKIILIFLLLIQWHAPFRFIWYYPIYVDPIFVTIVLSLLILIHLYKKTSSPAIFLFICFICFIGVYFRETIMLMSFSFIFIYNVNIKNLLSVIREENFITLIKNFKFKYILFIPSILAIISSIILFYSLKPINQDSFWITAISWLYRKSFIQYILGIYQAFGPIVILLLFFWREIINHLFENQYQLFFLILIFCLGFIGGSDTERILFWSFPVIYLLIGIILEKNTFLFKRRLFGFILLIQFISNRLFWIIPDYPTTEISFAIPLYTLMGNNVNYLNLLSFHSSKLYSFIFFSQYLITTIIVIILLFRLKKI